MDTTTETQKRIAHLENQNKSFDKVIGLAKRGKALNQEEIAVLKDQHNPYAKQHKKQHSSIENIRYSYLKNTAHSALKDAGREGVNFAITKAEADIPGAKKVMTNKYVKSLVQKSIHNIHIHHYANPATEQHYAYILTVDANNDYRHNQTPAQKRNALLESHKANVVYKSLKDYIQQSSGKNHGKLDKKFPDAIGLASNEIAGVSYSSLFHPVFGPHHIHSVRKLAKYWDKNHVVDKLYACINDSHIRERSETKERSLKSKIKATQGALLRDTQFTSHRKMVARDVFQGNPKELGQANAVLTSDNIQLVGHNTLKLRELNAKDPLQHNYGSTDPKSIKRDVTCDINNRLNHFGVQRDYPTPLRAKVLTPINEKLRNDKLEKNYELSYEKDLKAINKPTEGADFKRVGDKLHQKKNATTKRLAMEINRQQQDLGHNF